MQTIVIENPVVNTFGCSSLVIDFYVSLRAAGTSVYRRISHSDLVLMTRPYLEEEQLFSHLVECSFPNGHRHIRQPLDLSYPLGTMRCPAWQTGVPFLSILMVSGRPLFPGKSFLCAAPGIGMGMYGCSVTGNCKMIGRNQATLYGGKYGNGIPSTSL